MLFDLNKKEGRLNNGQYDVCICGAGPAGITIARSLAKEGKRVCLLEGGSLEYTELSQSIYNGQSIGDEYWDGVHDNRLRYLGGTSGHWGGRCALFSPGDFEPRMNYFGLPGWPISRDDVFYYLDDAKGILDLPADSLHGIDNDLIGENFRLADFALSPPTRFGDKYLDELKHSKNIDLYINANSVDVLLKQGMNSVANIDVVNFNKNHYHVIAKSYVLAMGALETPRLLLNSNHQMTNGIGNQHDMVGRCFMEHLNVDLGRFVVDDKKYWTNDALVISPTDEMMMREKIGNAVLMFSRNMNVESYGRLKKLKQVMRDAVCSSDLITGAVRSIGDFNCVGDGVISTMIEQQPNLKSRVTLSTEKDEIELRRIVLDWEISDTDLRTIRQLGIEAAKAMAKNSVGRVQLRNYIIDSTVDIPEIGAHAHQMGTTRMALDPQYGVVDPDCRVHGIENLYIAGSGVFPTGAGSNPTLTIIMLSLKLSQHLLRQA